MKTPTLPTYTPKTPLKSGAGFATNVLNYGPAPKGWRWREIGEFDADGDIIADGFEGRWRSIYGGSNVCSTYWPIATPVKVSVKRDSRGRFAPEVAKKVLPDLGDTFRDAHSDDCFDALKSYVDCIDRVLVNAKDGDAWYGIFGWSLTPQGFKHWSDRQDGNPSPSPEDLDYLRAAKEFFEKRIVELTPPPPKPPTVPELQAKISSLEAEVASLRHKIAGATVTFPSL